MNVPSNKAGFLKLPDPSVCRGRLVLKGVVDCLVERAFLCPHAMFYGNNILCTHPSAEEIVANTLSKNTATQPTPPGSAPHKPVKVSLSA